MHDERPGRRRGQPRKATCRFELVDAGDPRLDGRPCRAREEPGAIVIYCARPLATDRAVTEMNDIVALILDAQVFVQRWPDDQAGPRWLAPEPRHYAAAPLPGARVETRPAGEFADDAICQHVTGIDGAQLWTFAEPEITGTLVREWNAFLVLLIGDGLWGPGPGAGGVG